LSRSKVQGAIASLVAASGAVLSVTSGAAFAADEPPKDPGASGISQYVEMVPTAGGPKAPGITKETKTPLPRRATKALEAAPPATAEPLEKVATSSSYGAPTPRAKPSATSKPIERSVERTPVRTVAVGTTVEAIATTSDARLLALLAVVFAIALSAIALAAMKARRE
jgi:hypothetical protein